MSFQQALIVLTLLGFMCYVRVHSTDVTSLEDIDKRTNETNINVNNGLQMSPWGRNMLTNWLLPRNNSARFGVNTSNSTIQAIRQLRFTPMNAVLSSFIYSLSVVPLFLALTSVFTPAPHGMFFLLPLSFSFQVSL